MQGEDNAMTFSGYPPQKNKRSINQHYLQGGNILQK